MSFPPLSLLKHLSLPLSIFLSLFLSLLFMFHFFVISLFLSLFSFLYTSLYFSIFSDLLSLSLLLHILRKAFIRGFQQKPCSRPFRVLRRHHKHDFPSSFILCSLSHLQTLPTISPFLIRTLISSLFRRNIMTGEEAGIGIRRILKK